MVPPNQPCTRIKCLFELEAANALHRAADRTVLRQLTETEVRQFYVAYRAMEATAHTLKDEAERFIGRQSKALSSAA